MKTLMLITSIVNNWGNFCIWEYIKDAISYSAYTFGCSELTYVISNFIILAIHILVCFKFANKITNKTHRTLFLIAYNIIIFMFLFVFWFLCVGFMSATDIRLAGG